MNRTKNKQTESKTEAKDKQTESKTEGNEDVYVYEDVYEDLMNKKIKFIEDLWKVLIW